jgi:transcriptional regulator with XRE-family HTH domain
MAVADRTDANGLGDRVRKYRTDRGLTLTALAAQAGLSKSFVSSIENGETPRPSAKTLYAIAEVLGVTMSDLLGRRLLTDSEPERPDSLQAFAHEHKIPEADVRMLATINFRGGQPKTKERWAHIYSAIRGTEWMDQE